MVKANKRSRSKSQSKSPIKSAKMTVGSVLVEHGDNTNNLQQPSTIQTVQTNQVANWKTNVISENGTRNTKQTCNDTLTVQPLNQLVLRSQVIAPEISGIRCIAINSNYKDSNVNASDQDQNIPGMQGNKELLVARENGSFVLYKMISFQNIVHFAQIRHTGGRVGVTITKVAYIHYCYDPNHVSLISTASNNKKSKTINANEEKHQMQRQEDGIVPIYRYSIQTTTTREVDVTTRQQEMSVTQSFSSSSLPLSLFVASYLSGQLVLYNGSTLFPVKIHQRTGGAIWDMCVQRCYIFTAMGDGSWHQLRLVCTKKSNSSSSLSSMSAIHLGGAHAMNYSFDFELLRIVPSISGADRALCVHANLSLQIVVGCDDRGNVNCWHPARVEEFYEHQQHERNQGYNRNSINGTNRRLTQHVTMWTRRLTDGMGLCVTTAGDVPSSLHANDNNNNINKKDGSSFAAIPTLPNQTRFVAPIVAIGTSTGDVVLLHALHGHVLHTFSQHKGPVTTIIAFHHHPHNVHNPRHVHKSLYMNSTSSNNVNNAISHSVSSPWSLYASGWHESIRCYRCEVSSSSTDGIQHISSNSNISAITQWYPAQVKRRSHYHEAVQLLIAPDTQLFLSASRDGTIMYSALNCLFTQPAMYVNVSTQQFTLCPALLPQRSSSLLPTSSYYFYEQQMETQNNYASSNKTQNAQCVNLLFQSRIDRVQCFAASTDLKHWNPLFAYRLSGKFHLNRLWCEGDIQHGQLSHLLPRFIAMSSDERVVIAQLSWKYKTNSTLLLKHIDEVVQLPAGSGIVDAIFVSAQSFSSSAQYLNQRKAVMQSQVQTFLPESQKPAIKRKAKSQKTKKTSTKRNSRTKKASNKAVASKHTSSSYTRLYLLKDDEIVFVKLTLGFPVIRTSLVGNQAVAHVHQISSIRPTQIIFDQAKQQLLIFGLNGSMTINVNYDGTPCISTININKHEHSVLMFVRQIPVLDYNSHSTNQDNITSSTRNTENNSNSNIINANGDVDINANDEEVLSKHVHSTIVGLALPSRQSTNAAVAQLAHMNSKRHVGRYYAQINSDHPVALPKTLPHDTVFMAQVHPAHVRAFTQGYSTFKTAATKTDKQAPMLLFIARFSKGLLLVSEKDWKMVSRLSIEGAGIVCSARSSNITDNLLDVHCSGDVNNMNKDSDQNMQGDNNLFTPNTNGNIALTQNNSGACAVQDGKESQNAQAQSLTKKRQRLQLKVDTRVLVLERNLEKTLQSLPLCWKVRRFGN